MVSFPFASDDVKGKKACFFYSKNVMFESRYGDQMTGLEFFLFSSEK
jgi:hypothetical protein